MLSEISRGYGKVPCNSNFAVVVCILLCRMVFILQSVDEILKSDHSVETYRAVLSCGVVNSLPLSLRNINSRVEESLGQLFPVNLYCISIT